ncbi:MAG: hypothetical protein ABSG46_14320 [Candidatus Binataceae bacterium]
MPSPFILKLPGALLKGQAGGSFGFTSNSSNTPYITVVNTGVTSGVR